MKAGTTYGQKIDTIYKGLKATNITNKDIKTYFGKDEEPKVDPVKPDTTDDEKGIDIDKANTVLALLEKILNIILGWFKKSE